MSGLKKRFGRVGFIKPVGQEHVNVGDGLRVDKDVQLMKEFFELDHCSYPDMSPVLVPRSYTKSFIDGRVESAAQEAAMRRGMAGVSDASDITVCEGTGHVGVGSIIGLSNAEVAKQLDAEVVLVANGGIGSAFDELDLNRAALREQGVGLRGVVINKVIPDKVDMIRDYFGRALADRWGVPLLGVVPDLPFLGKPTLGDIEKLLNAELIAGQRFRSMHYGPADLQVVTTGVRRFIRKMNYRQATKAERRPLFVTHCTRDDVLLGYLAHYKRTMVSGDADADGIELRDERWIGAIVMCRGDSSDDEPEDIASLPYLMEMARAHDAPILITGAPRASLTS